MRQVQKVSRRKLFVVATSILLAGCKVIPTQGPEAPPPPRPGPTEGVLPSDGQRHRVALLVPLTGTNAMVGQAIANAATMAVLDTNARNIRITNYDTGTSAASAAAKAIADGNRLILGPLSADDIPAVASAAQSRQIPVISFSSDDGAAGSGVFVMGSIPAQSITRTVTYARQQGARRFAALVPAGDYGQRASSALMYAVHAQGGTLTAMETFDRRRGSLAGAARRLVAKGGYDAVLIADAARLAAQAAPLLKPRGRPAPRLLGTELWSGDVTVSMTPAMRGGWFSAVSDSRFRQFAESYQARFGAQPPRLATLGYDSVLLTVRLARDWRPGTTLPITRLVQSDSFVGVDGAFRFTAGGVIERAFEVREVRAKGVTVVSPAPASFGN
ncbi:MAG: penicillin-binding protein activator [Novosphingobium sp.]